MTFAPDERARFVHESHRLIGGRCVNCGASPAWPIAERECPLRGYADARNFSNRLRKALRMVRDGANYRTAALECGIDDKTVAKYARQRMENQ